MTRPETESLVEPLRPVATPIRGQLHARAAPPTRFGADVLHQLGTEALAAYARRHPYRLDQADQRSVVEEPAEPRHLTGRDEFTGHLADQHLLMRHRDDVSQRGPLTLGDLGRLLDLADRVLAEQGQDGRQIVLGRLPDPHHEGRLATTKTRRNGSTVPQSCVGYASRSAVLSRRTKSVRRSSVSACSTGRAPVPESQV